jgi:hypothetical protein
VNPKKISWFKKYMDRMNFTDKYQSELIEKDKTQIPNPDKDKGITGFEVFFWLDTYTDNLNNNTNEQKFNYISKIATNILIIKPAKPFAKYDYTDSLTFGGNRFKNKYLKYKNKYLELKNKLKK